VLVVKDLEGIYREISDVTETWQFKCMHGYAPSFVLTINRSINDIEFR